MNWPWKRREWENRGRFLSNAEIADAFNKWFGGPVPISPSDPGKRCIERELFEELARKYSRPIPPHSGNARCDCDKRTIMRLGDIYRGWAFESQGREGLGVGYIDLHRKGAPSDHEELYWIGPNGEVQPYEVTDSGIVADKSEIDKVFRVRA